MAATPDSPTIATRSPSALLKTPSPEVCATEPKPLLTEYQSNMLHLLTIIVAFKYLPSPSNPLVPMTTMNRKASFSLSGALAAQPGEAPVRLSAVCLLLLLAALVPGSLIPLSNGQLEEGSATGMTSLMLTTAIIFDLWTQDEKKTEKFFFLRIRKADTVPRMMVRVCSITTMLLLYACRFGEHEAEAGHHDNFANDTCAIEPTFDVGNRGMCPL
jgi:hypothetical protein